MGLASVLWLRASALWLRASILSRRETQPLAPQGPSYIDCAIHPTTRLGLCPVEPESDHLKLEGRMIANSRTGLLRVDRLYRRPVYGGTFVLVALLVLGMSSAGCESARRPVPKNPIARDQARREGRALV